MTTVKIVFAFGSAAGVALWTPFGRVAAAEYGSVAGRKAGMVSEFTYSDALKKCFLKETGK